MLVRLLVCVQLSFCMVWSRAYGIFEVKFSWRQRIRPRCTNWTLQRTRSCSKLETTDKTHQPPSHSLQPPHILQNKPTKPLQPLHGKGLRTPRGDKTLKCKKTSWSQRKQLQSFVPQERQGTNTYRRLRTKRAWQTSCVARLDWSSRLEAWTTFSTGHLFMVQRRCLQPQDPVAPHNIISTWCEKQLYHYHVWC